MTLLVIAPDYASHYLPLSAVAARAAAAGRDVIVATGPSLRGAVERDGHRWRELVMSVGSNPGVRATRQAGDDLGPFLAATRRGMVATLRRQAEDRQRDLLWEPSRVAATTVRLVEELAPDSVIVDHLCLAARLGLYAAGVPSATFVPGHPSQLPQPGEVYGFPVAWPAWVDPDVGELAALRRCCEETRDVLAERAAGVVTAIDPGRPTVSDVFAAHGATVLFNSPAELFDPERGEPPTDHRFLGSCVRAPRPVDAEVARWLDVDQPFVFVSLGTFLAARTDVLARVSAALVAQGRRAAVAVGASDPRALGSVPSSWLVRATLPQVELLERCDTVISHGGNNTVTEALTAGRPLLTLPLSTEQFCIAADLERVGLGRSVDPNRASVAAIGDGVRSLDEPVMRASVGLLAARLRTSGGGSRALAATPARHTTPTPSGGTP